MAKKGEKSSDGDEASWKEAMESNAMRAAKRISQQLSGGGKPGFEGIGGASKIANLQAVEEVKESVQELVSEEMMRLGELVGRKEFGLAEAIAKERNERFFL